VVQGRAGRWRRWLPRPRYARSPSIAQLDAYAVESESSVRLCLTMQASLPELEAASFWPDRTSAFPNFSTLSTLSRALMGVGCEARARAASSRH
jgi:hypothetical protein